MREALLYWHTVRHLRPVQIGARLARMLHEPRPDLRPAPPLRQAGAGWIAPARRRASMTGPDAFLFLNKHGSLADGWDDPAAAKLWRYNLHYFDDLNAEGAEARKGWHADLIERWIADNPPGLGTGWEPYPTSLRIVNWTKWLLAGNEATPHLEDSLAIQARWLSRRIEHHLQGNHLLANAKALIFAGALFDDRESRRWRACGCTLLARELKEQILPDGGHFEVSPLYHALALEDLLDLVNLERACPGSIKEGLLLELTGRIEPMLRWLRVMSHPDGEIAFFNDAAFRIAPSPEALEAYAGRQSFDRLPQLSEGVTDLPDSGYLRVATSRMVALLDLACIGPDHQPGHAHADTLSFELSLDGRRVIVNSGTSEYGTGPERQRQRGTRAHNTVTVERRDSSEVWSGFRVARRARPSLPLTETRDTIRVACSHDGYSRLPCGPIHRRHWEIGESFMEVQDFISGPIRAAEARYHFAPGIALRLEGSEGAAMIGDDAILNWRVPHGRQHVEASSYHPEFGLSQPNQCLVITLAENRAALRIEPVPLHAQPLSSLLLPEPAG